MLDNNISQKAGLLNIGINFTTVVVIKKKFSSRKLFLPLLPIVKDSKVKVYCHGTTVTTKEIDQASGALISALWFCGTP